MEVGHPNHLLSRMILQVPPNLQNPRVGTCAGISFLRPEKTSIFLNEKTLKCAIDRVRGLSSFQIWEMDGNGWVTPQTLSTTLQLSFGRRHVVGIRHAWVVPQTVW